MTLPEIGPHPSRILHTSDPTPSHRLCPPRALGAAQLCAVRELTNNDQGVTGDLTRPWAVGPANFHDGDDDDRDDCNDDVYDDDADHTSNYNTGMTGT